MMQKTNYTK